MMLQASAHVLERSSDMLRLVRWERKICLMVLQTSAHVHGAWSEIGIELGEVYGEQKTRLKAAADHSVGRLASFKWERPPPARHV